MTWSSDQYIDSAGLNGTALIGQERQLCGLASNYLRGPSMDPAVWS